PPHRQADISRGPGPLPPWSGPVPVQARPGCPLPHPPNCGGETAPHQRPPPQGPSSTKGASMSLVYTRTIKTLAGPVILEVEDIPRHYAVEYRYSFKAADGVVHHSVLVPREQIAYNQDIVQHV